MTFSQLLFQSVNHSVFQNTVVLLKWDNTFYFSVEHDQDRICNTDVVPELFFSLRRAVFHQFEEKELLLIHIA